MDTDFWAERTLFLLTCERSPDGEPLGTSASAAIPQKIRVHPCPSVVLNCIDTAKGRLFAGNCLNKLVLEFETVVEILDRHALIFAVHPHIIEIHRRTRDA